METSILKKIRKELIANSDAKSKANLSRAFKEKVNFLGVNLFLINRISKKQFQEIKKKPKEDVFGLCEGLLKSDYVEERFVAFNWAYELRDKFEEEDFTIFERWIDTYVSNWAECDTLCNHTVGAFVEEFPQYIENLKEWTQSKNRWKKRAAAVTLILPARKGMFLKDVFEIADKLLLDEDDLVQKGYGWMLKEASKAHQKEVFDYIIKNKKVMPRTALRYAIEKMPKELKAKAMEK